MGIRTFRHLRGGCLEFGIADFLMILCVALINGTLAMILFMMFYRRKRRTGLIVLSAFGVYGLYQLARLYALSPLLGTGVLFIYLALLFFAFQTLKRKNAKGLSGHA